MQITSTCHRRDLVSNIGRLISDRESAYLDTRLVCTDGTLKWNLSLLTAYSPLLRETINPNLDHELTLILPDTTTATLGSMLRCALNPAVRTDTLSVNEMEVVKMLGFTSSSNEPQTGSEAVPRSMTQQPNQLSRVMTLVHEEDEDSDTETSTSEVAGFVDNDDDDEAEEEEEHPPDIAPEPKKFSCPREGCAMRFTRTVHLAQHVASHDRNQVFPCPECGKLFYHANSLKEHLRYHRDLQNGLTCDKCQKVFKGRRSLKNHIDLRHIEEKCDRCDVVLSKRAMKKHVNKEHPTKDEGNESAGFFCHICLKEFETCRALMVHKRSHEGQNGRLNPRSVDEFVKCSICKKLFASQDHLEEHTALFHIETQCKDCGKMVIDLPKHRHNVHTLTKSAIKKTQRTECPKGCGKVFYSFYAAKDHATKGMCDSGTPAPPKSLCNICNKSYLNLKRHFRETHSENRFECPECGHFFPVKHSLERHIRNVHHPVKIPCPYCEIEVRHLVTHLVTGHNIGKPEAKAQAQELTGKSSARTDLQFTARKGEEDREDMDI